MHTKAVELSADRGSGYLADSTAEAVMLFQNQEDPWPGDKSLFYLEGNLSSGFEDMLSWV